jgi:hypothetical protein
MSYCRKAHCKTDTRTTPVQAVLFWESSPKHQDNLFRDIFETYFGNFNWEHYSTKYSVSLT